MQRAVNGFLYQVARTRGAVVVKEVVTIYPVFGAVILFEQGHQFLFLLGGEVQFLLPDIALQVIIFCGKTFVIAGTQLVVCFAEGKAENKVRCVEVEYAVVEYGVDTACIVLVSYGCMSEKGIYFFARSARQQADAYGVRGVFRGFLCPGGRRAEEKEDGKTES